MSYLTRLAKKDQDTSRFYIGFYILAFFLPISLAVDIAAIKAEGQLSGQNPESRPSQGLIINWDCCEWFITRPSEEMTIAGVQALVDQYIGTQVSSIFFNPTSQRTAYASKVRESFWDQNEKIDNLLVKNTRLLHQKGIDPYQVWIARCREKDISPWISMRMNDLHYTDDPDAYTHGSFWREHPEYRRVPGSKRGYSDQALDYSIKEVRDHNILLSAHLDVIFSEFLRLGKSVTVVFGCQAEQR